MLNRNEITKEFGISFRTLARWKSLGGEANGMCADLIIVEIETPAYLISSYDGQESVITPQSDFIFIPENA